LYALFFSSRSETRIYLGVCWNDADMQKSIREKGKTKGKMVSKYVPNSDLILTTENLKRDYLPKTKQT